MRTSLLVLALSLASLAVPATASADGWYVTEGMGSGELGSELGEQLDLDFTARLSLGRRMGNLAIEAMMIGNILSGSNEQASLLGYGISAKYLFPMGRHLDLYFRGGLHKSRLVPDTWGEDTSYRGRALHYGAGAQIKTRVPALGLLFAPLFFSDLGPKMTVALWFETGGELMRLHRNDVASYDASTKSWLFGLALGSDF